MGWSFAGARNIFAHALCRGSYPRFINYSNAISVDMEGVVDAVTGDRLGPGGFEYVGFRELMTGEVAAAIEGAKAAGASEILVADSHGNGQNLLIEQLPEDVEV